APLAQLGGTLADFLVERDEGGVILVHRLLFLDRRDDGAEVVVGGVGGVLDGGGALLTLKQELHAAESALDLPDARDDAHRVEDVWSRLIGVVALCDSEYQPVALECR